MIDSQLSPAALRRKIDALRAVANMLEKSLPPKPAKTATAPRAKLVESITGRDEVIYDIAVSSPTK